jgi:hypothetical protein
MKRNHALVTAALLVAALGACGDGGGDNPLADSERAMAELKEGRITLQLDATAGPDEGAGPVGFRMEGPFSFAGDGTLPVLDLQYTRLLGENEQTSRVLSTGEAMYVVADGQTTAVPANATGGLRLGEADGDGGFADLGIAGWIEQPVTSKAKDGSRIVTGELDVADLLSDLARTGAQAGIGLDADDLDGDAEHLRRQVQHSEMVVEIGADDLPRSVQATVDFGDDLPPKLAEVLGPYASTRIHLTLSIERLAEPLRVAAPRSA